MKILQTTFYRIPHPGGVLQAYALQVALRELGHAPELVKYDPIYDTHNKKTMRQRIASRLTGQARTDAGYERFRTHHLTETSSIYRTIEELESESKKADCLLCGSDQIWNAAIFRDTKIDPVYLLGFGADETPRVSYSASMGGWVPENGDLPYLKKALSRFSAISVREPSAQRILEKALGRRVHLSIDPTLLPTNYDALHAPRAISEDYVLVYGLDQSTSLIEAAHAAAKRFGVKLVTADGPLLPWRTLGRRQATRNPEEWISLIKHARAVVTNSYHGMVFSLINQVPVYVPPLTRNLAPRNERIFHLCDKLDITGNLIAIADGELPTLEIDWNKTHKRICEFREEGYEFLSAVL